LPRIYRGITHMRSLPQILIALTLLLSSSYSSAQCGDPAPLLCDANGDWYVDSSDITAIGFASGSPANFPVDMRDIDGDGTITVLDARLCVAQCNEPLCGVESNPNDSKGPEVELLLPASGVGLPVNSALLVRFDEELDQNSASEITAFLMEAADTANVVEGEARLSDDGYVLVFDPETNLKPDTGYIFNLGGARDLAGNPMALVYSADIVTADAPDNAGPAFTTMIPHRNALDVATNVRVQVDFDEIIDPTTFTASDFHLTDGFTRQWIDGVIGITADGRSLFLIPDEPLPVGRDFSFYANNIKDLAGNTCANCGLSTLINFVTSFLPDTVPPVVVASTFPDGAADIPLNMDFTIRFDEALDPGVEGDMQLGNGEDAPVTFTVSGDRRQITVMPVSILEAGTQYTLAIRNIADLTGNEAEDISLSFTTGSEEDTSAGILEAWSFPLGNTQLMPLDMLIAARYSERVDPTTLNSSSVRLYDNTERRNVPGRRVLDTDGRTVRFIPTEQLEPYRSYRYYVGSVPNILDLAGNRMQSGSRSFNTGNSADPDAPSVSVVSIGDGAVDLAVNSLLVITLDEPLGEICSPEALLSSSVGDVAAAVSLSGDRQTLTLTPAESLATSATYTLSLSGLCDFAGNTSAATGVVSFTTSTISTPDTTAPNLLSANPADDAVDVPVDTSIVLGFDEPIDQTSRPKVTGTAYTDTGSYYSYTAAGAYSVDGSELTFVPDAPFRPNARYRVDLSYNIPDLAGNTRSISSYQFVTAADTDVTPPTLKAISPMDGAVGVHPLSSVELTFSEPLKSNTLGSSSLAFYANGKVIWAEVYRSLDGQGVSLRANLPPESVVSLILTDGIEDLSGNPLVPTVSSFTTGPMDTATSYRSPRVEEQIPRAGSRDLYGIDEVVLRMSEPMDAASLQGSMHVAADGLLVEGTLELLSDAYTIRFIADSPFPEGAYVQVFLEDSAKDTSGYAVSNYDGYFYMGSTDDGTGQRPRPLAYSPGNGQTGVPLNPVIMVHYTEPLDSFSLNSALIDLQINSSDESVPVDVSLDATGTLLQVTPQSALLPGVEYQLLLDNIIDTDGDINTSLYSLRFTTGADAVVDDRRPTVLLQSPPNGSTGVGVNAGYAVRYDDSINPLSLVGQHALYDVMLSEDNQALSYRRFGTLEPSSEITEPVPAVTDLAGNPVVPASTTFTTAAGPDYDAGRPVGSIDYDTVPTNAIMTWLFEEPVDPVSITASAVYLRDSLTNTTVPTTATLSADGLRIDMVPLEALAVGRDYRYYARDLRDLSGNKFDYESENFETWFEADTQAPEVVSATVSDGQTGVPLNVRLRVRFDEPMNLFELGGISLVDGSGIPQSVVITFDNDRDVVTIRSSQLLKPNADYTITVDAMQDLSANTQLSPYEATFTTHSTADLKGGSVTSWNIENNQEDVPLDAIFEIKVTEAIDPTTLDEDSFRPSAFSSSGQIIAGEQVLSADGRVLRFEPTGLMNPYQRHALRGSSITDLAGNNISIYTRYFYTGGAADSAAPVVSLLSIAEGSSGVAINSRIVLNLDERIEGICSPEALLTSSEGDVAVALSFNSARTTLTLTPQEFLSTSTLYSLSLNNLCDLSGNELDAVNVVSFTTSASPTIDFIGPGLVSISPVQASVDVPLDTAIVMTFDEPVDQTSKPGVFGGGLPVTGSYLVTGNVVTFTPDVPLQGGTQYTVDLGNTVADYAGHTQSIGSRYFTTVADTDTTAPTLMAISPVDGALGVHPGSSVELTFSEPMSVATVSRDNIAFYADGSILQPTIMRSADGRSVSLTANLPALTTVSVILTGGLEDLSGNALVPTATSFSTAAEYFDSSSPRVVQQIPARGESDLFGVDEILLLMSKPMDAASLDGSVFVAVDGVLVDGTLELLSDAHTIRFKADSEFPEATRVQVYMERTATDTVGIPVYDYDGYFYTAGRSSNSRPYPEVYSPFDEQHNVPLNPRITVRYSEPLDETGLGGALIDLQVNSSNASVPVDVSLGAMGLLLEITPQVALLPGTEYELLLDDIVDVDGDTNTSLYRMQFTTGADAVVDDRRPLSLAQSPPHGATDVPTNPYYSVRLDETLNPLSLVMNASLSDIKFSEDNQVVRYRRRSALEPLAEVTEHLPLIKDLAGNEVMPASSTFFTGETPDFENGRLEGLGYDTVTGTNPIISWLASKPVDPTSITDTGVYLRDSLIGRYVPASVTLSADGRRIDLVPLETLAVGRYYRFAASGVRDLSGNTFYGDSRSIQTTFSDDVLPPELLEMTVRDGQSGVPINVRLQAQFDEPLLPGEDGISLVDAGGVPHSADISFSSDRTVVVLTLKQLLQPNSDYTFTVGGMRDISGNEQVAPHVVTFTTGATAKLPTSTDWKVSISDRAGSIPLNPLLQAELSQAIDPTTVNAESFRLYNFTERREVSGERVVSADGRVLRFIPDDLLHPLQNYSFYIGSSPYLSDLAGNRIFGTSQSFKAGESIDTEAPTVEQLSVVDGAADVPVNGRVVVTLSEPIGLTCSPEAVLTSAVGNVQMDISLAVDYRTLTLTPTEALATSTQYSLTLNNFCDFAGQALDAPDFVSFTTSASSVADNSGPTLLSIIPANDATDVSIGSAIVMTFDETISQMSRPRLTSNLGTVSGTYSVVGNVVTFTPDFPLLGNTRYRMSPRYEVRDLAGNPMGYYTYDFTTEAAAETTPPTLLAISPVDGAVGFRPGAKVELTFSEPMSGTTLRSDNLAFYANGEIIRPGVSRSADGRQVSLTAYLPPESVISVILSDAIEDLSGNALVPTVSSFTTAAESSLEESPHVVQQIPPNGATDQFGVEQILLLMNQPMDAATLEGAVYVSSDGVLVDGALELLSDGHTISFTADAPFPEEARVQIFLQDSVAAASGFGATAYDGYFLMEGSGGLEGTAAYPRVYSPYDNETDVPLNPQIMVQYNEPLDELALGDASIELRPSLSSGLLPIDVSLDAGGNILFITPQEALLPDTTYRLQLSGIVDADGDINTSFYSVEFTTAEDAVEDDRRPLVIRQSPPDGLSDVGLNVNYSVHFDEAMNPLSLAGDASLYNVMFSWNNRVIRYQRSTALDPLSEVTEFVPAMTDLAGNVVLPHSSTFVTGDSLDLDTERPEPLVTGGVATSTVLAWLFEEPVDPVSMLGGVWLQDVSSGQKVPISAALSADGRVIHMVPVEALEMGRNYRYYAYGLRDLSGNTFYNALASISSLYAEDVTPPSVLDATVTNGQVDVPLNVRIQIRFDEPLSLLQTEGISLVDAGGEPQSIAIDFNSDRTIVTVVPKQLLLANADYTLNVDGMQDLSGNSQSSAHAVAFSSGVAADIVGGRVESWNFENNATEVPLDIHPEVMFDDQVDPVSITQDSSFYLRDNETGEKVEGDWILSADYLTLRFEPNELLQAGQGYSLYVGYTPFLYDLAGNQLARYSRRTFYTVAP
jgi:large repetitive protein